MAVKHEMVRKTEVGLMQSGTNSLRVRDYNQQLVLEIIRVESEGSRVEIAEKTGLTAQTISNIVRRLLDEGLIVEAGKGPSDGSGKPRMRLRISPEAGYAMGVHIDRDEILSVLIDLGGRVVGCSRSAMPEGQDPSLTMDLISDTAEQLVEEASIPWSKVLGIGVASPGALDIASGVVYSPPGLSGWQGVGLKKGLEERTGSRVIVENDAIAAAVGEHRTGKAQGTRDFAFVYGGWGIGAGLFVDGRVCRGNTGAAGEIAHLPLDPAGPECSCGNRGCLTRYCAPKDIVASVERRMSSGETSTLREISEGAPVRLGFEAVRSAALAGDILALDQLKLSGHMLGLALVSIANLFDPEMVVLGGRAFLGVEHIYEREVEIILDNTILYPGQREFKVEFSKTGEQAVAVGAASLMMYAAYAPQLAGTMTF